jgi:hypothetical protein
VSNDDFGDLEAPPKSWWRRRLPKKRELCYRVKSDALKVFLDRNTEIVERWGGPNIQAGCSEFDSVNRKYGLESPKTCARTIAEAAWASLRGSGHRGGPPYCLDEIDLEALNATSPGRIGGGFQLPDIAHEEIIRREEERYYEQQAIDQGEIDTCHTQYRDKRSGRYKKTRNGRIRRCVKRDGAGRFEPATPWLPIDDDDGEVPF